MLLDRLLGVTAYNRRITSMELRAAAGTRDSFSDEPIRPLAVTVPARRINTTRSRVREIASRA